MAVFAPVAPVQILRALLIHSTKMFGDYHLFLAHHTVDRKEEFTDLLQEYERRMRMRRLGGVFIMDNSIVELGGAVNDDMIKSAVLTCQDALGSKHHVIPVLPDVMSNGAATIDLSHEAYLRWHCNKMPGHGFMLVAQGESLQDFYNTVDHFLVRHRHDYPEITTVGIPRVLVKNAGTRQMCVRYLTAVAPHVMIHLLGFSDDVVDDIMCSRMSGVQGIDSAVPVRYPSIFAPTDVQPPRAPDWFEKGELGHFALENISNVRRWVARR